MKGNIGLFAVLQPRMGEWKGDFRMNLLLFSLGWWEAGWRCSEELQARDQGAAGGFRGRQRIEFGKNLQSFSVSCHVTGGMGRQEGGMWINLGPLLYHWADSHTYLPDEELSIELSLEEVVRIACLSGFRLLRKEMVPSGFNVNMRCAPSHLF